MVVEVRNGWRAKVGDSVRFEVEEVLPVGRWELSVPVGRWELSVPVK